MQFFDKLSIFEVRAKNTLKSGFFNFRSQISRKDRVILYFFQVIFIDFSMLNMNFKFIYKFEIGNWKERGFFENIPKNSSIFGLKFLEDYESCKYSVFWFVFCNKKINKNKPSWPKKWANNFFIFYISHNLKILELRKFRDSLILTKMGYVI